MKGLGKIAICLAVGLALSAGARAQVVASSDNPYAPIVARNVFGLNPVPAVSANATQADPPLKITLNGIMSVLGQAQALFKVAPKPGQPGAKEESYILGEGQQQDEIEVTHIDERAGIVTFNNHGTVQDIPLANAPVLTPTAAPGGPPGRSFGAPGGVNNGGIPARLGGGRVGARFGGQNGGPGNGGPGAGPGMNTSPTRASGYSGQTMAPQAQNTVGPMSAEESELLVVANKLKALQENDPALAVYPPTSLDQEAGVPSNEQTPAPTSPTRR